MSEIAISL